MGYKLWAAQRYKLYDQLSETQSGLSVSPGETESPLWLFDISGLKTA